MVYQDSDLDARFLFFELGLDFGLPVKWSINVIFYQQEAKFW
jgi:hypothetical protein